MDGGDIGRKQGQTDDGPGQGTAGEEIVLTRALILMTSQPDPASQADDSDQVGDDDDEIQRIDLDLHGVLL